MVSVRQKLTEPEAIVAFVIGAGITLILAAVGLAAAQNGTPNFDASRLNIILVIGGLLVLLGVFAWLMVVRPWKNFDDWSTPLYTGHDDHGAHDTTHDSTHNDMMVDDLTSIEGITAKVNAVLNGIGITTFAQLAARQPAEIERIVADSGIRASGKAATWIAQAKAASKNATH